MPALEGHSQIWAFRFVSAVTMALHRGTARRAVIRWHLAVTPTAGWSWQCQEAVLGILGPLHRAEWLPQEEWEPWEHSLCGVLTRVLQGQSVGL